MEEATSPSATIAEIDRNTTTTTTNTITLKNEKMKSSLSTTTEDSHSKKMKHGNDDDDEEEEEEHVNEEKTSSSSSSSSPPSDDDDEDTSSSVNSKNDRRTYTYTTNTNTKKGTSENPKQETRSNTDDMMDDDDSETDTSSSLESARDERAMDCDDDDDDDDANNDITPKNNIVGVERRDNNNNNVAEATSKTTTFDDEASSEDDESLDDDSNDVHNNNKSDDDSDSDSSNSDMNYYRSKKHSSINNNNHNLNKRKEYPKHIDKRDITLMTSDDDDSDDSDDDESSAPPPPPSSNDDDDVDVDDGDPKMNGEPKMNDMDGDQIKQINASETPAYDHKNNSSGNDSSSNTDDLDTDNNVQSRDGNLEQATSKPHFDGAGDDVVSKKETIIDTTNTTATTTTNVASVITSLMMDQSTKEQKEIEEDNFNIQKKVVPSPKPMYRKIQQQQQQQPPPSSRGKSKKSKKIADGEFISLRVPTDIMPGEEVRYTVGNFAPDILYPHEHGIDIIQPHEHDVLCGRGGLTNSHSGNEWFRRLVRLNKGLYHESRKHSKLKISKSIVHAVYARNPPGRFLEVANRRDRIWHEISHKRAIDKSSQALRERENPDIKNKFVASKNGMVDGINQQQSAPEMDMKGLRKVPPQKDPDVVLNEKKRKKKKEENEEKEGGITDIAVLQAQLAKEKADRLAAEARLAEYENQKVGIHASPHPSGAGAAFGTTGTTIELSPNNNHHHHRMSIQATAGYDATLQNQAGLPPGIGTLALPNSHQNSTMMSPSSRINTNPQLLNAINAPMSTHLLNNSSLSTRLGGFSPLSNAAINNGRIMAAMNNSSSMTSAAMMANPLLHNQQNPTFYNPSVSPVSNPNWAVVNSTPIGTKKGATPMSASVTAAATAAAAAMTSPRMTSQAMTDMLLTNLNIRVYHQTIANTPPQDVDVICGRGGAALRHKGNQFYRRLVELNKGLYVASPKNGKIKVSRGIVNSIYIRNGRFMEKVPTEDVWYVIADKKALEKTSQALREDQEEFRRKMILEAASQIPLSSSLSQATVVQNRTPAGLIPTGFHSQPAPGSSIQNSNLVSLPNERGDSSISRNQNPAVQTALIPPQPNRPSATANAADGAAIEPDSPKSDMNPNFVYGVTEHDVLCGRGVNIAEHPGNLRFRALVKTRRDDTYHNNFTSKEKKALAWEIVKHIQSLDPPGRFLSHVSLQQKTQRHLNGPWKVLGQKECIEKACQALHDCNRQDRPDYAASVAVPDDVEKNAEEREKQGLSLKEHAAAMADAMPPPVARTPAQTVPPVVQTAAPTFSFDEARHRRALEFALSPSPTTNAKKSSSHAVSEQTLGTKKSNSGKATSKSTSQKQSGTKRKVNQEPLPRDSHGLLTPKELRSAVKIVKNTKAEAFPGVTMKPSGSWQTQVYYTGQSRYVGVFDTREKAALAFVIAKEKLKSKEPLPTRSGSSPEGLAEACFEAARTAAFNGVSKAYPSTPARKKHKTDTATKNEGKSGPSKRGKAKAKAKKGKKLPTKPAKILQLYLPSIIGGHRGLIHN